MKLKDPFTVLLPENTEHILLQDDGIFPNNEKLAVIIYRHCFQIATEFAAEDIINLFQNNNWNNAWDNGIYNYHHYHSTAHEVLGIYAGNAEVQLGGPNGLTIELYQGDVIFIPAGVAHKCIHADANFACVGAYPQGQQYDMNYGKLEERVHALKNISLVSLPEQDAVFGSRGILVEAWSQI